MIESNSNQQIYENVSALIPKYLNCEKSSIYEYNKNTDEVLFLGGNIGCRKEKMKASESIIGYCAKIQKVIHVSNTMTDKRIHKPFDTGKEEESSSLIAIPIRNEIGVVHGMYFS